MTRDELALEQEHLDLLDRLAAAKASGDRDELHAAKQAITAFRQKWRNIRAEFSEPGAGEARPETLAVKLKKGS